MRPLQPQQPRVVYAVLGEVAGGEVWGHSGDSAGGRGPADAFPSTPAPPCPQLPCPQPPYPPPLLPPAQLVPNPHQPAGLDVPGAGPRPGLLPSARAQLPRRPLIGLSVAGWAWGPFPRTLPAGPPGPRRDADPSGAWHPVLLAASCLPGLCSSDETGGLGGSDSPARQPWGGQGAPPAGPFFPALSPALRKPLIRVLMVKPSLRAHWGFRPGKSPHPQEEVSVRTRLGAGLSAASSGRESVFQGHRWADDRRLQAHPRTGAGCSQVPTVGQACRSVTQFHRRPWGVGTPSAEAQPPPRGRAGLTPGPSGGGLAPRLVRGH